MLRPRNILGLGLAAGVLLLATSCASGDSDKPGASGGSSTSSLISAIKDRGTLRVGVATADPFVYKDEKSNTWDGVFIDLAKDWAETMDVKVEFVGTSWDNMVAGIQAGRYDLAPAINARPARALSVIFAQPVVQAISTAVLIPQAKGVQSWKDLDVPGNSICVQNGSSDDMTLTNYGPTAKILRLKDQNQCRLALQAGRADAFVDEWHAQGPFAKANPKVKVLFPPDKIGSEAVTFAVPTSATYADVAALNIQIDTFEASGDLARSMSKHGSVDPTQFVVGDLPSYAEELAAREFGSK